MRRIRRGFTLIELAIVLAVAALLLSVAVPAWRQVAARTHAASVRTDLLASLTQAATHAGITGVEVVVCPPDSTGCADQWDWSGGWIAFADLDGDRSRGAGEPLLRHRPVLDRGLRLFTSKGRKRLVFQPNGGNVGSNVTFTLCRGASLPPVVLVMANDGRLREGRPAAKQRVLCADAAS